MSTHQFYYMASNMGSSLIPHRNFQENENMGNILLCGISVGVDFLRWGQIVVCVPYFWSHSDILFAYYSIWSIIVVRWYWLYMAYTQLESSWKIWMLISCWVWMQGQMMLRRENHPIWVHYSTTYQKPNYIIVCV